MVYGIVMYLKEKKDENILFSILLIFYNFVSLKLFCSLFVNQRNTTNLF